MYKQGHDLPRKALKLLEQTHKTILAKVLGGHLHCRLAYATPEVFLPSSWLRSADCVIRICSEIVLGRDM